MIPNWKTCNRCRRRKPIAAFSRSAKRDDGLQLYCKQCQAKTWKKRKIVTDETLKLIKDHNVRHLTEAYENAVGIEARLRLRRAITQAATGE